MLAALLWAPQRRARELVLPANQKANNTLNQNDVALRLVQIYLQHNDFAFIQPNLISYFILLGKFFLSSEVPLEWTMICTIFTHKNNSDSQLLSLVICFSKASCQCGIEEFCAPA